MFRNCHNFQYLQSVEEKQKLYLNFTVSVPSSIAVIVEEKQKLYLNSLVFKTFVIAL